MPYNPYIVIPFAVWAITQIAKFVIKGSKGDLDFRYLYASGGMPSVHSAVVSSLATTAALVDGLASHLFGLTAIFAAIVMYDSFGVRRASGDQATALNMVLEGLGQGKIKVDRPELRLKEVLGHTPLEVVIGAITGVTLAALFNVDRLGWLTSFLSAYPSHIETRIYIGLSVVLIVVGVVTRYVFGRKWRKSPSLKHLSSVVFGWSQTVGWLGLVLWFADYERISYIAWRVWWIVLLLMLMVALGRVGFLLLVKVPAARASEKAIERRNKWLNFGRRKKR